jgi:hypothetical protein
MARVSVKVYEWTPKKGRAKGLMSTYDAIEGNLDTLFNIHITHKSWGNEWYRLVTSKAYQSAKMMLAARGKGDCVVIAMNCIDDLAYLMAEMKKLDKEIEVK